MANALNLWPAQSEGREAWTQGRVHRGHHPHLGETEEPDVLCCCTKALPQSCLNREGWPGVTERGRQRYMCAFFLLA